MKDFGVHCIEVICGNFVGILWEFPQVFVSMGWVWKLKSNSHGSPVPFSVVMAKWGKQERIASPPKFRTVKKLFENLYSAKEKRRRLCLGSICPF